MDSPLDRETEEGQRRYALAAGYRGVVIDWSVHLEDVLWDLLGRLGANLTEPGPTTRPGLRGPPATTAMIETLADVFKHQQHVLELPHDDPLARERRQLLSNLRHVNSLRRLLVHGTVDTGVSPNSVRLKLSSDVAFFAWWIKRPEVVSRRRVATAVRKAQAAAYSLGVEAGLAMR